MPITEHLTILDHSNSLDHGLFLLKLKKNLYSSTWRIQICKKHYNLLENEQDMPFQSEGGCALNFFISV
jgi:hypothetical protein